MNILVLQPSIPHYRLGLFSRIRSMEFVTLQVIASETDGLGVPSVAHGCEWACIYPDAVCCSVWGRVLRWQPGVVGALRRANPDVVVLHGAVSNLTSVVALLVCKLRRLPVVWWTHGGHDVRLSKPAVLLRVLFVQLCAGLLLYTQDEVVRYRRIFCLRHKPIEAIDNGVDRRLIDVAIQKTSDESRDRARALVRSDAELVLLFCGRLTEKSSILLLVAALRKCKRRTCAIVIGNGPLQSAMLAEAVGLVRDGRFAAIGESVGPLVNAPFFLAADVFVYPGNMGLSGVEALAFGLPVITHDNDNTQMPETAALINGENSLRFRAGDSDDLARQLDALAENPALLKHLRSDPSRLVRERFDIDRSALRFVDCVRQASGRPI